MRPNEQSGRVTVASELDQLDITATDFQSEQLRPQSQNSSVCVIFSQKYESVGRYLKMSGNSGYIKFRSAEC